MRISLPSGTPAEIAWPSSAPTRAVVVAPDIAGLRPLFDGMCARLAAEHGWAVAAVEPFPGREGMTIDERLVAVGGMDEDRVLADLTAAADELEGRGAAPAAVIGFCMGGMYAFKAAGTGRFDRAVSFYGMIRLPDRWREGTQTEPLDALRQPGACPVLAVIGTADHFTPPADVDDLEAAGATVVRYEGAEHGFVHDPDRPVHRPDDAADAWRRTAEFLRVSGP